MKKLIALMLLIFTTGQVYAQGTKATVNSNIASQITAFQNNTTGVITPSVLGGLLTSMVNSYEQFPGVNPQIGTTYTVQLSDYGQLVTFKNASPVAVTLPTPIGNFATFGFTAKNNGTGTVTLTPVGATINGASSLVLAPSQSVKVWASTGDYQISQFGNVANVTVGTTSISGGTPGYVEYNNGNIFGELPPTGTPGSVVLSISPTISNLTLTGSFVATGLVSNADLTNSSTLVNGVNCVLGASCTVTTSASAVIVSGGSATTITGGSGAGYVINDNSGVLGEVSNTTTVNGIPCTLGSTCSITASAATVNAGGATTGIVSGATNAILSENSGGFMTYVAPTNSGVLVYSAAGVPSSSLTIPTSTQANITGLGTVTSGTLSTGLTIALGSVTMTGDVPVTHGGTGLGTLTSNTIYKGAGTNTMATTALTDNGTVVSTSEPFDLATSPVLTEITNNGGGTTLAKLVTLTGAPSTVINAITSTKAVVGPVVGGAGASGSAQIAVQGRASCAFDGATVAGDYVQISTAVAGDCADAGSTYPTSGQVLGRVLSTNGGAGTYAMIVFPPEVDAASGGGGGFSSATIIAGMGVNLSGTCNSTSVISCTINTPWSYSGANIFTNNAGTTTVTNGAVFSSTITAASLSTVGTVAGSVCSTNAGLILYDVGTSCYNIIGNIDTPEAHGGTNAAAIRAALSALNGLGGGTLLLSCNQTYTIDSAGTNALINLYNNVNIKGCGNSSVLKVTYGSAFNYVLAPSNQSTNIYYSSFSNFKVDVNSDLNINQTSGGAVWSIQNGGYLVFDGISIYNNPANQGIELGSNVVSPTVVDAKIVNSSFNTSCTAVAGSTCNDHSSIYMFVDNGIIANNNFEYAGTTCTSTGCSNAIEAHGNNISITGNNVLTYFSCFIPAADDGAGTGAAANISFVGNNCYNVYRGVNMYTETSGTFVNLVIASNTFNQSASATVPVIDTNTNNTGTNYGIAIKDNVIYGNGAGTTGIALGKMFNAMVSGNIIADVNTGINKIGNATGSSLIVGNQFNLLAGSDIAGSGTGWSTGCFVSPSSYYNGYGIC